MALKEFSKEELKRLESQFEETIRVASDGIGSITGKLVENLKKAAKDTTDELEKATFSSAARSLQRRASAVDKQFLNALKTQKKLERGELSYNQVVKAGNKLRDELALLEFKRQQQNGKLSAEEMLLLAYYRKETEDLLVKQEDLSASIERKSGALGEIFTRLSKTPFVGQLLNAQEATEEMRKSLLAGENGVVAMGRGFKAMFKGLGPVVIGAAIIKGIIDLLIRADELTTKISKNFGVTRAAADAINNELRYTNNALASGLFTLDHLHEGFQALVDTQGVITYNQLEQAEAAATLIQRIGLSADQAGFLVKAFEQGGKTTLEVFNNMADTANAMYEANGFQVTGVMLMKELGETSADVLANFAFQGEELAKAVFQTRRFGVSLTQAKNIASGLLDFEQSIGAELEAEILLGRQFNFERARALAATGDIAGATEEVLAQTKNLNDEQLRSPIIQEAIAKATGLSSEEFIKARRLTKALEADQGKLAKKLEQIDDAEKRRAFEEGILRGQSFEEIQKNLTAQEKFNIALTNAKDLFAGVVNSGALQFFAEQIPRLLRKIAKFTGDDEAVARADAQIAIQEQGRKLGLTQSEIAELQKDANEKITDYEKQFEADKTFAKAGLGNRVGSGILSTLAAENTKRTIKGTNREITGNTREATIAIVQEVMNKNNQVLKDILAEQERNTRATRDNNFNNITN